MNKQRIVNQGALIVALEAAAAHVQDARDIAGDGDAANRDALRRAVNQAESSLADALDEVDDTIDVDEGAS